jgi:hypothetical protein
MVQAVDQEDWLARDLEPAHAHTRERPATGSGCCGFVAGLSLDDV